MPFDATLTTYKLTQSTASFVMWTAPSSRRIFSSDAPPTNTRSSISIDAAKQEFEPFQVIVSPPASGTTFTVSISTFDNLGSKQVVTIEQAQFDSGGGVTGKRITDFIRPITNPATLSSSEPFVIWITVYVPIDASAGTSTATLTITPNGQSAINIPVTITVHNWVMPINNHFEGIFKTVNENISLTRKKLLPLSNCY
jgi:hypothetical protein